MTMEYRIIEANTAQALADYVNAEMQADWQPLGAPFYIPDSLTLLKWGQALVREITDAD